MRSWMCLSVLATYAIHVTSFASTHGQLFQTRRYFMTDSFRQNLCSSIHLQYSSCSIKYPHHKSSTFHENTARSRTILFAKHANEDKKYPKNKSKTNNVNINNNGKTQKNKKNQPKNQQSKKTSNNNKAKVNSNNRKTNDKNKIKSQIQKTKKGYNKNKSKNNQDWLNLIDPYQAGKKLRQNLKSLSTFPGLSQTRSKKSIFYLDDRIFDTADKLTNPPPSMRNEELSQSSSNIQSLFENPIYENYNLDEEDNAPEVLVVGATGEVGRKIVQRLVRDTEQRFRVRVLVRDLYSKTLNLLGSGVTYCQGDLQDVDSLEYAVTDVDKIIFCAGAPRVDEVNWREKFEDFVEENLEEDNEIYGSTQISPLSNKSQDMNDYNENEIDWKNVQAMMDIRSRLAEQVDFIGMQNLLKAYQNVRFADYGTSQAAKRSLFKFQSRPEDFDLFAVDEDDYDDDYEGAYNEDTEGIQDANKVKEGNYTKKGRQTKGAIKSQYTWMRNKFGNGVLTGRLPVSSTIYPSSESTDQTTINSVITRQKGSEAAIVSGRLRSREDPKVGLDLGNGFAGLLCRICSDGGKYEAFIRTGDYTRNGVEYVCVFETGKKNKNGNKSSNKFVSLRLPFLSFRPIQRRKMKNISQSIDINIKNEFIFNGNDVQQIGFRFRSEDNVSISDKAIILPNQRKIRSGRVTLIPFYLAFSYIKVYRSQVEPEFIYVSDARIPSVVRNNMVKHEARYIEAEDDVGPTNSFRILDENNARKKMKNSHLNRSDQETYFKYLGEQILRNSGLWYVTQMIIFYLSSELILFIGYSFCFVHTAIQLFGFLDTMNPQVENPAR